MSNLNKILKYLTPSRGELQRFVTSLILLGITLIAGYFYIPSRLAEISTNNLEQKDILEKKNNFLKHFIILGQSRIYLAENYYLNIKSYETQATLARSWDEYMQSVVAWNKENLLNPIFIGYYFGEEEKDRFNNELLPKMVNLHSKLLKIKKGEIVGNMPETIESAKHELFIFSEKLISENVVE